MQQFSSSPLLLFFYAIFPSKQNMLNFRICTSSKQTFSEHNLTVNNKRCFSSRSRTKNVTLHKVLLITALLNLYDGPQASKVFSQSFPNKSSCIRHRELYARSCLVVKSKKINSLVIYKKRVFYDENGFSRSFTSS